MGKGAAAVSLVHAAAAPGYPHQVRTVHQARDSGVRAGQRMGPRAAAPAGWSGEGADPGDHSKRDRNAADRSKAWEITFNTGPESPAPCPIQPAPFRSSIRTPPASLRAWLSQAVPISGKARSARSCGYSARGKTRFARPSLMSHGDRM